MLVYSQSSFIVVFWPYNCMERGSGRGCGVDFEVGTCLDFVFNGIVMVCELRANNVCEWNGCKRGSISPVGIRAVTHTMFKVTRTSISALLIN